MGFWEEAFDNVADNFTLAGKALLDGAQNLNPFSDQFATGRADNTAAEAERQNAAREGRVYDERRAQVSAEGGLSKIGDAASNTGAELGKKAGAALETGAKAAGSALDALTNPWIVVPALLLVGLVVAAPYVTPLLPRR